MSATTDLGELTAPVLLYGGSYSNLQATEALLAEADRLGIPPDHRINTGDIVAYCADAGRVSDLVMTRGGHVVLGNCEESFGAEDDGCGCGFEEGSACDLASRDWVAHANDQLTPAHRACMAARPERIRFRMAGRTFDVTHGGFSLINRFIFQSDAEAIAEELALTDADVVIGGHSGLPFVARSGERHWLNAGVIGMPFNDGDVRTGFMVLTPGESGVSMQFHRLSYDNAGAAAAMDAALMPPGYRDALLSGLWPNMDVMPDAMKAQRGQPLTIPDLKLPAALPRAA